MGLVVVFAAAGVALQGLPLFVLGVGVLDADSLGGLGLWLVGQRAASSGAASLAGLSGGAVTWPGNCRASPW
jgi:hypothetical protein